MSTKKETVTIPINFEIEYDSSKQGAREFVIENIVPSTYKIVGCDEKYGSYKIINKGQK